MKITNRTKWDTEALRAVISACIGRVRAKGGFSRSAMLKSTGMTVEIHSGRSEHVRCSVRATHMWLQIPVWRPYRTKISQLTISIFYALAHAVGWKATSAGHDIFFNTQDQVFHHAIAGATHGSGQWFRTMLAKASAKDKTLEHKLTNARKRLKMAGTRRKRATTIEKGWQKEVHRLEKIVLKRQQEQANLEDSGLLSQ